MVDRIMKSYEVLGVNVQKITIHKLNDLVKDAIINNSKKVIANHNLHSVYLFHRDSLMKIFYEQFADYVHIDGMPIVWAGKLLGYPLEKKNRIGYMDWMEPLMTVSDKEQWRIFYLGSRPGVAAHGLSILHQEYPKISFAEHHGYFDMMGDDNLLVLEKINEFSPHILFVGMGMPRQEHWIVNNYYKINANILLNAGACIDYIAGEQVLPPRILGYMGVEWLFRLLHNPRKLWHRYIIEPWALVPYFMRDLFSKLSD